MKKSLLITPLLFVLSTSAFSQVLWQKAETGMTPNQIKKEFSDAVETSTNNTFSNGGKALLHIPNYHVGSDDMDVQFVFRDEKLYMVRMEAKTSAPSVTFNSLKNLLKSKYGQPLDATTDSISQNLFWKNEGVDVRLANIMGIVVISYKDAQSSDANKL